MSFITFTKWMWIKLSDICLDGVMERNDSSYYILFLGWGGHRRIYARFLINRKDLPNGKRFDKLLVAHEGDWITKEAMMSCYHEFEHYEEVQKSLGKGLIFRNKGFSKTNRRSLFLFDIDNIEQEHILAVPATGEEFYFEIYGVDSNGDLVLLVKQEL